jgi:hypothetical protein
MSVPKTIDGIAVHASITGDRIVEAVERHNTTLDNPGFCLACGADADGCEPDMERGECEACGEEAVYGADELLIRIF